MFIILYCLFIVFYNIVDYDNGIKSAFEIEYKEG